MSSFHRDQVSQFTRAARVENNLAMVDFTLISFFFPLLNREGLSDDVDKLKKANTELSLVTLEVEKRSSEVKKWDKEAEKSKD